MSNKKNELNEFISAQVIDILEITKINILESIEFIQNQKNPHLNLATVKLLNNLSTNTVESFNKILINSQIGYVEENYIVLTKYFEFDSLFQGTKKIPYSLLFMDKFISIQNEQNQNNLVPTEYEIGENTLEVLNNLEEIVNSIDLNITLYRKLL